MGVGADPPITNSSPAKDTAAAPVRFGRLGGWDSARVHGPWLRAESSVHWVKQRMPDVECRANIEHPVQGYHTPVRFGVLALSLGFGVRGVGFSWNLNPPRYEMAPFLIFFFFFFITLGPALSDTKVYEP